ncbi:allantoate permease, putative [Talaromyces stipitatus ATCC 10500]|uniref:Allantoate permease, putative n=1 Tax=Talaromyces stipitatus (strain ATCC 10500 / CBS 375.48 / QM 6759 / NRRL 1006) TaxID=441959 RepID=B8MF69_TALSN|nr:allantoate permease, putative [Talaromyces stipitatus ATCC 10500]EED16168.1 allantoate permease, putative [Talaromyces stipitatus ATCC 10500]
MSGNPHKPRAGQQQRHPASSTPESVASSEITLTRWQKIESIIWDGGYRTPQERALVRRLDIFIMSWATIGYFVRLLDWANVTNAYVSGMKEDLHFTGADYNLLSTFFIIGYVIGQVPSQMVLTRVRPSYWLPTCELLWSIVTFCFAAVQNVRDVFALRIIMGFLEAPFAVGVLTIMGSWYTPRELSKRIAIFYSACYAASMFSGYLQAGIYNGMDNHLGLAGWRWLFIFCGVISLPFSIYGYIAIPDNPYNSKAFWMSAHQLEFARKRMEACDRRPPVLLTWAKMRRIVTHWPLYAFTAIMICQCLVTQPLNYFAVWLKSLHRFSVYQVNVIPTAGQAVGLITTLTYSWLADAWGGEERWKALLIPAVVNLVGLIIVSIGPGFGATLFGYLLNGASWGFWPICFAWTNEVCASDPEERAIVIGVAQTMGQAFVAWVPILILNTSKYAPKFTMGWSILTGISVCQLAMVFVIRWLVMRDKRRTQQGDVGGFSDDHRGTDVEGGVTDNVGRGSNEQGSSADNHAVPSIREETKV